MLKPLLLFASFFLFSTFLYAFDFNSDTSGGSQTFSEALSFDGYWDDNSNLTPNELAMVRRSIWSADYIYSRQQVSNSSGVNIADNTSELDLGAGYRMKKTYEYGVGLTYAVTPDENLRDVGPNIYYSKTLPLAPPSEDFYSTLAVKLMLSDLNYVQTFTTSILTRTGKSKPVNGESGINQLFPTLALTWNALESLTVKGEYAHYFYSRNVNDFLATLDSPRAVAVGIFGLTNAVSSFNTDLWQLEVNWFPIDKWEFDAGGTIATSAIDGSSPWTLKESVLFDFSKYWSGGLSYEYEQSNTLVEHLYTITFKYSGD